MPSLEDYLAPGDAVLDIGANLGTYAEKYARVVGPEGYVLAIEPDPAVAAEAREKLKGHPRVTVMAVGVGAAMGPAVLYRDTERKRSSLWADNRIKGDGTVPTHLVTLDYLVTLFNRPLRGIKIDAQGAEAAILEGGAETLKNRALTWYVEVWPMGLTNAGSSAEHVCDVFEAAGWAPVGQTWASIRAGIPTQKGHGAMDILLRHREAA